MALISTIVSESTVTLDTSQSTIAEARPTRTLVQVSNQGGVSLYIYYTSGASGGYEIVPAGATWQDSLTNQAIYAKAASGTCAAHILIAAAV